MNVRRLNPGLALGVLTLLAGGCMPKMTIEDMKAMRPQRPSELDRLDAFTGRWEMEGECTMKGLDEVLVLKGTSESRWNENRHFLVGNFSAQMGELEPMKGLETWTYDAKAGKYRNTWVDDMGSVFVGVGTYDEKSGEWRMKAKGYGPLGKTTSKGTFRFVDENTAEWTWNDYTMGGLMKMMSMKGTSRRR